MMKKNIRDGEFILTINSRDIINERNLKDKCFFYNKNERSDSLLYAFENEKYFVLFYGYGKRIFSEYVTNFRELSSNSIVSIIIEKRIEASIIFINKIKKKISVFGDYSAANNLYYMFNKGFLYFSNSVEALIPFSPMKFSTPGVALYLQNQWVNFHYTLFESIYSLLPFVKIELDAKILEKKEINFPEFFNFFWALKSKRTYNSPDDAINHFKEIFNRNLFANSSGSRGVYLSGGLDSSIVAAALTKEQSAYGVKYYINNFAPYEIPLVKKLNESLQKLKVDFLEYYPLNDINFFDEFVVAIKNNPLSPAPSDIYTQRVARFFKEKYGGNFHLYNGEVCSFDLGFSLVTSKTRKIRRNLFLNNKWANIFIAYPLAVGNLFENLRLFFQKRASNNINSFWARSRVLHYGFGIISLLSSIGNAAKYLSGEIVGNDHFPGFGVNNFLFLNISGKEKFFEEIKNFVDLLFIRENQMDLKRKFIMMNHLSYVNSSNLSMYTQAAKIYGHYHHFPFSSPDMLELTADIPISLFIDKTIERMAAVKIYNVPNQVAYYPKNMTNPIHPNDVLYGNTFFEHVKEYLKNLSFINGLNEKDFLFDNLLQEVKRSISDKRKFTPLYFNLEILYEEFLQK